MSIATVVQLTAAAGSCVFAVAAIWNLFLKDRDAATLNVIAAGVWLLVSRSYAS